MNQKNKRRLGATVLEKHHKPGTHITALYLVPSNLSICHYPLHFVYSI